MVVWLDVYLRLLVDLVLRADNWVEWLLWVEWPLQVDLLLWVEWLLQVDRLLVTDWMLMTDQVVVLVLACVLPVSAMDC